MHNGVRFIENLNVFNKSSALVAMFLTDQRYFAIFVEHRFQRRRFKTEDLKRSPNLLNNFKIGNGQFRLFI